MMAKAPMVGFSPTFKGAYTQSDLLHSEGTFFFLSDKDSIERGGYIFKVLYHNFIFCLNIQNNSVVLQRNAHVAVVTLDELLKENRHIGIFAMWSHDNLTLDCRAGETAAKRTEISTTPTAPPSQLIRWARKQNLIPTETYKTEEEFREKIHAGLLTVNQKIREADAYKSFWNIVYDGNKIIERLPKKEVEIQGGITTCV